MSARHAFNMRAITSAVIVQLLRGRITAPRLFLLSSAVTVGRFKKSLPPGFPAELVELAAPPVWTYKRLKARLGQPLAFEIMRVAILTGGIAQWNVQYATLDMPRTFDNFVDQEIKANQSGITRWNKLEVVAREPERFALKVTRCLFLEFCIAAGVPELTPVVCQIDNAAFNAYMPTVSCSTVACQGGGLPTAQRIVILGGGSEADYQCRRAGIASVGDGSAPTESGAHEDRQLSARRPRWSLRGTMRRAE